MNFGKFNSNLVGMQVSSANHVVSRSIDIAKQAEDVLRKTTSVAHEADRATEELASLAPRFQIEDIRCA